jgi:hypothetical protein
VAGAAVVAALRHLSPGRLRLLGSVVTATGVMGLLVFIGRDLSSWLGPLPPEYRRYALQRILFAIGTSPDRPLVQVVAAGAVCWALGRLREKRGPGVSPGPNQNSLVQ